MAGDLNHFHPRLQTSGIALPNHLSSIPTLLVLVRRALEYHRSVPAVLTLAVVQNLARLNQTNASTLSDAAPTTAIVQPRYTIPPMLMRSILSAYDSAQSDSHSHRLTYWRMWWNLVLLGLDLLRLTYVHTILHSCNFPNVTVINMVECSFARAILYLDVKETIILVSGPARSQTILSAY